VPLGRPGPPQDIARTAAFLLDEDSGWINDQTIIADCEGLLRVEPAVTQRNVDRCRTARGDPRGRHRLIHCDACPET
jgi:NAD(P)-dependent dehydrogenase (short-subunit alcohol dehydrogenase family)